MTAGLTNLNAAFNWYAISKNKAFQPELQAFRSFMRDVSRESADFVDEKRQEFQREHFAQEAEGASFGGGGWGTAGWRGGRAGAGDDAEEI